MVEFNPNARPGERTDTRTETLRPYRDVDRHTLRDEGLGTTEVPRPGARDARSMADLFRELMDEARLLIRQEARLAKAEVVQKTKAMGRHAGYIVAGGALAYAGLLAIVAAACAGAIVLLAAAGLSLANSLWLGPLIVGIIVLAIGYGLYRSGMSSLKNDDLVPHRTAQTMRENAQWMQERVR
jgi:hypothetical protein